MIEEVKRLDHVCRMAAKRESIVSQAKDQDNSIS